MHFIALLHRFVPRLPQNQIKILVTSFSHSIYDDISLLTPFDSILPVPLHISATGRSCGLIGHLFVPSLPAGEMGEICGQARCCQIINCASTERNEKMCEALGASARSKLSSTEQATPVLLPPEVPPCHHQCHHTKILTCGTKPIHTVLISSH